MFRLSRMGVRLILRERKVFLIFTVIYSLLIFLTSLFLENIAQLGEIALFLALIFIVASVILSLLYAWLLVRRNKRNWATLKCIGYTNGNIIRMLSGIILFTALLGFFVVVEILFHYTAALAYLSPILEITDVTKLTLIGLTPVTLTSFLFLGVQILSIALIYRKVLNVRPIVALKQVEA
ncbi:MAG: FtsX-like permease family protein [Promethearchaeota archaeon]|nr:MAG: FtsX-like permease family protein [Candidatus Lokiarchaeota archaeon]